MTLADDAVTALDHVTTELPGGGERREGQRQMAEAVASALITDRHLVVQAGTGTGKSLAYLVPAVLSGRRTIVVTATKALQDQLVGKDLPFLEANLDHPVSFAMLKGRSNYLCRQRVSELVTDADQLALDGLAERASEADLAKLLDWAEETETGDRAELDFEPSPAAWSAVSVGVRECPGATKCPKGDVCLAEQARRDAAEADVVVVNTHLYGTHLANASLVLPDHEVVVFDEAHQLEDTISATSGFEIAPGRFRALVRTVRAILADDDLTDTVEASAARLTDALADDVGRRLRGQLDGELAAAVVETRERVNRILAGLRKIDSDSQDVITRRDRAMQATTSLVEDLDRVMAVPPDQVAWVEGPPATPVLRVASIDVSDLLADCLWGERTAILTSATIPTNLTERVGLTEHVDELDVGSPFDFEHHALLYCAAHIPDPRKPGYADALHDELAGLIEAAGGRTLALFTSWRAMTEAAEVLAERLDTPVLTQRDLPKPALVRAFTEDDATSLFATMGFWQGVDVPGPSLALVTIDRLPFPRPDDPLLQARRERARAEAFRQIDLPRAATLLAQGAGRLIRTAEDRGVVAVLDSRLATGSYRWDIVNALPPMHRTKDAAEAVSFLREIDSPGSG